MALSILVNGSHLIFRCGNVAAILELDEHLKRSFTIFEAAPQVCVHSDHFYIHVNDSDQIDNLLQVKLNYVYLLPFCLGCERYSV